jgi:hypothetical protein
MASSLARLGHDEADTAPSTSNSLFQPSPGGAGRALPGKTEHPHITYGMPDVGRQDKARFETPVQKSLPDA